MDKRSESQFAAVGTTVIAPAKTPSGDWTTNPGSSRVDTGTPQDVMKSVASTGRLFEGHNKKPISRPEENEPKWGVQAAVSGDISRSGIDVATKEGRRAVAEKLGLPNKKEFRAKKKK